MAKEKCVLCGDITYYDFNTPVDLRENYIEGAGQLCEDCWKNMDADKDFFIKIPKHFVYKYSNDQELGQKVRANFYKNRE